MPPAGFEPAIPASERLHTHALDCIAMGIVILQTYNNKIKIFAIIEQLLALFSFLSDLHCTLTPGNGKRF
jgi:hypothetical protein